MKTLNEGQKVSFESKTDLRGVAQALNDRGVRTARGGRWHVSNMKNILDRAGKASAVSVGSL